VDVHPKIEQLHADKVVAFTLIQLSGDGAPTNPPGEIANTWLRNHGDRFAVNQPVVLFDHDGRAYMWLFACTPEWVAAQQVLVRKQHELIAATVTPEEKERLRDERRALLRDEKETELAALMELQRAHPGIQIAPAGMEQAIPRPRVMRP